MFVLLLATAELSRLDKVIYADVCVRCEHMFRNIKRVIHVPMFSQNTHESTNRSK